MIVKFCMFVIFVLLFILVFIINYIKNKNVEEKNKFKELEELFVNILSPINRAIIFRVAILQERIRKDLKQHIFNEYVENNFSIPKAYHDVFKKQYTFEPNLKISNKMNSIEEHLKILAFYEDLLHFYTNVYGNDMDFDLITLYEDSEVEGTQNIVERQKMINENKDIV